MIQCSSDQVLQRFEDIAPPPYMDLDLVYTQLHSPRKPGIWNYYTFAAHCKPTHYTPTQSLLYQCPLKRVFIVMEFRPSTWRTLTVWPRTSRKFLVWRIVGVEVSLLFSYYINIDKECSVLNEQNETSSILDLKFKCCLSRSVHLTYKQDCVCVSWLLVDPVRKHFANVTM